MILKSVYENSVFVACMQLLWQIIVLAPEQHPALRLSCKRFASIVGRQLTLFRFASDSTAGQSKPAGVERRQHNAQMQLLPDHFPNVAELELTCPTTKVYSSLRAINRLLSKIATRWRLRTIRLLGNVTYRDYAGVGSHILPQLVANFPALAHLHIALRAEKEPMRLLSQMTSLESLEVHLHGDTFSINSEVWPAVLLRLRSLSLSFSLLTVLTATSPICTMTGLRNLALKDVRFENAEAVHACQLLSSLQCLELDGRIDFPHAEMLSGIAAVTQLVELRLRNGDMHSHFPHATPVWQAFRNMPRLQSLDITIDNRDVPTTSPSGFSQLTCLTLRLDTPPMPAVPSHLKVLNLFIYNPRIQVDVMHVPARLQDLQHLQALAVHSTASFLRGHDLKRDFDELATILRSTGLPRLSFSSYWEIDEVQAEIDAHFAAGAWNGKGIVVVPSPPRWPAV